MSSGANAIRQDVRHARETDPLETRLAPHTGKAAIINADDLGICRATNTAIGLAFRDGVLTSASLMVNMPAFADALDRVVFRHPALGVGIHLVLTSGRPVLDPAQVPLLVDRRGHFCHSFIGLARMFDSSQRRAALRQIRRELRAQFEKARSAGVALDHVDSHQHVHMLPPLWSMVQRLAVKYGAGPVRNSDERVTWFGINRWRFRDCLRPLNVIKVLTLQRCAQVNARRERHIERTSAFAASRHFVGVRDSGRIDQGVLLRTFASLREGVTEIVTHPGTLTDDDVRDDSLLTLSDVDRRFLNSLNRRVELSTLLDQSYKRLLASRQIRLISHRDLPGVAVGRQG
jgi:predicted glycoside hydrolase/deacetylase ChbG (UPF0249 family)